MAKRGQVKGSSAGTLVGIITLIIIFYILFLPPAERKALLGDDTPGNGVTTTTQLGGIVRNQIIFTKNIGRIDVMEDVLDKALPNVYISQSTSARELATLAPVYVKNGVFDKKFRNATFSIDDLENTNNVFMTFTAPKRKGVLTIRLNGATIFDYSITKNTIDPIRIDKNILRDTNILQFEVSGVGYAFWDTNEYSLESIRIMGEVTDVTKQKSKNMFTLTEGEYANIETATLKFIPYCTGGRSSGTLYIAINNKNVFSSVPICSDPYFIPISPRTLSAGENNLVFSTSEGSYSVEQTVMNFETKPTKSIVYYFEMDRKLFTGYEEVVSEAKCGEIDGYCPEGCNENIDKDCCFAKSTNNYWCDLETNDADDRCAASIDTTKCNRCATGYENSKGDPPKACEDICGDDTDKNCPTGCSINYDKDCCFSESEDNYWCNDVPVNGLSSVCESSLSSGECDECPYGYKDDGGSTVKCDALTTVIVEEGNELKKEYNAMIYITFVDDGMPKKADLNINGHLTRIDQDKPYFTKDVSNWVQSDNNYIEIFPLTTLNIVKLEIRLE